MPPVRRRRANKGKDRSQLGPGDLVLAKVRGFPPWPAKISIPEYWKRSPDPKKYFVEFFGTQEIGFVAPEDIQAFTNEVKSKLSARCQRKTAKCFAQAVKEICLAFDELNKNKSIGSVEDTGRSDVGDGASSVNGGEDDGAQVGLKQDQVVISDLMRARLPVSIKQPSFVDPEDVIEVEKEGEHLTKDEGQDYSWATSCSPNSRLVLSQNMPTFRDGWKCGYCATDETPVRRMGPMGPKTLCGACGLQYLRQWELEQQQQREQQRFQLQLQYHQQLLQLQHQHQQEIQFQRQEHELMLQRILLQRLQQQQPQRGRQQQPQRGQQLPFWQQLQFLLELHQWRQRWQGQQLQFWQQLLFLLELLLFLLEWCVCSGGFQWF